MSARPGPLIVPALLLLCILLGGSSVQVWQNTALQLVAVLIIGLIVALPRSGPNEPATRLLIALAIAAVVLVIIQLVPLPPGLWQNLPGRAPLALGFATLGYPLPPLPLSWTPYKTLESAFSLLPPAAILLAILRMRDQSERSIASVVIVGALLSVVLGALQAASSGPQSWVYLYKYASPGAVGFFANRNHMATLLLAAVPFSAALFAAGHPHIRSRSTAFAMAALGAGGLALILVGLILNGSLAALALAAPVVVFSGLLLPAGWRLRRILIPVAVLAFAAGIAVLATSWIRSDVVASVETDSLYSRSQIWSLTLRAIADTFPAGTGLGTFTGVYAMQEDPATVTVAWVNHAHNDYIELLLEAGLLGLLLMLAFFAWFIVRTAQVWRSPFSSLFAKAATIAAAAVLAHSIVDYPLRTTAIAAIFAACLGMMAGPPRRSRSDEARHVRIA